MRLPCFTLGDTEIFVFEFLICFFLHCLSILNECNCNLPPENQMLYPFNHLNGNKIYCNFFLFWIVIGKAVVKANFCTLGRGPKSLQTSSNSCGSSPDPKHAVTQSENVVNYDTEAILDPDVPQTVEIITDDQQASFSDQFNPETLKDVESSETRKNCENRQHVETQPLLDSSEDDEFAARSQEKNAMELDDSDVADSAFLLSLLPEMRLMSKRQKSHFKKITMSVLDDVLYGSGSSS